MAVEINELAKVSMKNSTAYSPVIVMYPLVLMNDHTTEISDKIKGEASLPMRCASASDIDI